MEVSMKTRPNRRLLPILLIAASALLAVLALLFYTGTLQFNHPSPSRYPIRGVDVSAYQGTIDWETLSSQGIRFAYIKATEGSSMEDRAFRRNWEEAGKTGLRIGAYHFFSFETSGKTQAENFIAAVGASEGMLPPAADVEPYGTFSELTPDVTEELAIWLAAVERHYGIRPILYTTQAYDSALRSAFPEYRIWIRSVFTAPSEKNDWTIWQYSCRTRLDGYDGEEKFIDMNVFAGTEEEFTKFCDP